MAVKNTYDEYAFEDLEVGDQDYRWCHKYARDVVCGKILAGKWIRLACERHLEDLERDDVYFDVDAAKSVVAWFKRIPITDGKKRGQMTVLLPWQIFICCCLIAWKQSETGFRKYKYAYVQVGRKNGKSTLAGGLTLYLMYITFKEGGYKPRCFSVATKREQAKELWSAAKTMINLSRPLQQVFKSMANEIQMPRAEGVFKPLASDSNTLDGLNPLMVNLDECHAIPDRNLYGVMVSAFGAQEEGLMLTITTAGTILDGLCTDLNKNGKSVLDKTTPTTQDSYFYAIYELDKGDKWDDEKNWYKANPGLGYQPRLDYMRDRCAEARLSVAEKSNFLTKHCNLFVSSYDKWLNMEEVLECKFEGSYETYSGRTCFAGIDRSVSSDITSLCLLFPNELYTKGEDGNPKGSGGADCFYVNLLPRKTMENATDYLQQIYKNAVEKGNLILVDTATILDEDVIHIINWAFENFDIQVLGYDPYQMKGVLDKMSDKLPIVSVSQGPGNMSEPSKKLEQLIKEQTFRYNDVMLEFACTCAVAYITGQKNLRIIRENDKTDKIDPLIATIIALSCAILQEAPVKNPYEKRGLLCV